MKEKNSIQEATELLHRGGVVAFPTETVYGLGAEARNARAVRRIFEIKGRPSTNPLIVHVADEAIARRYVTDWSLAISRLVARFWPGPLTIVLPKNPIIVDEITAGLNTVALRVPNHPLALELLRTFDGPVAAPSANRSTHLSPTTAQHVRDELGDSVDLILDGGPCEIGIESTVLDLSTAQPTILRPGVISREQIEQIIGPVGGRAIATEVATPASSPGQQLVHYAPRTPAYRFEQGEHMPSAEDKRFAFALFGSEELLWLGDNLVQMPKAPDRYAHHLYSVLRKLDAAKKRAILIELPPESPQWAASRDRIFRGTRPSDAFHPDAS